MTCAPTNIYDAAIVLVVIIFGLYAAWRITK